MCDFYTEKMRFRFIVDNQQQSYASFFSIETVVLQKIKILLHHKVEACIQIIF